MLDAASPAPADGLPPPASAAEPPAGGDVDELPVDPWRLLRRQQDRRRYLRILTPPRIGKEKPRRPSPAAGVPRASHLLLGSPATMTRTATNFPDPDHVRQYLKHSADLTMRGGLTQSLIYPMAVCALAEHYVFRRIAGSGAGAVAAAASAAAELGRGAPDPEPSSTGGAGSVGSASSPGTASTPVSGTGSAGRSAGSGSLSVPGFAGLAGAVGWLVGQDVAGQDGEALAAGSAQSPGGASGVGGAQSARGAGGAGGAGAGRDWPEQRRLARMFQPSAGMRPLMRIAVALTGVGRHPQDGPVRRGLPIAAAVLGSLGRAAWAVTGLLWLGLIVGWSGVTIALSRTPGLRPALVTVTSVGVLIGLLLAGLAGTLTVCAVRMRGLVGGRAEEEYYGIVPGIAVQPSDAAGHAHPAGHANAAGRPATRLDRWAGLPSAGDVPPLVAWVADLIDDLAGSRRTDADQGAQTDRYALTFGDLWLGRISPRSRLDAELLRRAADDPGLRTIDLALVTTNTSQGRPYTLPFATAERAEREGTSRFLFCRMCLSAVLPGRVVAQMILMSPAQATESQCPRHPGETLHEVPDPWDFPVVAAVRLSMATPGLLRAVPLYTLDVEAPGPLYDEIGREVSPAPTPSGVFAPRVHWFCDGDITRSAPVQVFDSLLPRWPTFAFGIDEVPTDPIAQGSHQLAEWLTVPEQDALLRPPGWRRVSGPLPFAAAVLGAGRRWRETLQADLPGFRGRVAVVRSSRRETAGSLFMTQPAILRLALRGYHAGATLRDRFTGPDGEVAGQTQTDRYRWIRLRMALREYRDLSLDIGARLPLYSDLAASYRVPGALTTWFTPPLTPGTTDPAWPDAAAAVTHLRALSAGGVLDWDTDYGAPPVDPDAHRAPYE